uniref:Ras association domain family member 10 n=1 Tax=Anas platyrhynchos platyrhynchos TaxID=8840 RepID=A0A493T6H1_ANAPP
TLPGGRRLKKPPAAPAGRSRPLPMEPEERKISVWICQEEKLISGLSRRTTCSDVVRVLLEDSHHRRQRPAPPEPGGGMLSGPPHSYCIVEKWRGFERILPNKTKILRLWVAWGDEQENVRFVLVRSEASLPNAGPRSAEARVVLSKERPGHGLGAARGSLALTQERQRRAVRKAFRKLAKINKKRQQPLAREASAAERMETLVHLVLSQDHTIRQQIQRLRELDREIDKYEAKIHLDRMKRHGVNYVQDTYLVGAGGGEPEPEPEPEPSREAPPEEDYARKCEAVLQLQEQRAQQEELLEHLAAEIQQELNDGGGEGELQLEHERVRTQLSTSLYIGLKLSTDLEAVKTDLDYTQRAWEDRERELQRLLETLGTLDVAEAAAEPRGAVGGRRAATGGWLEQARALHKDGADNDEDSDTGLSSMHSQDSDSLPVSTPRK